MRLAVCTVMFASVAAMVTSPGITPPEIPTGERTQNSIGSAKRSVMLARMEIRGCEPLSAENALRVSKYLRSDFVDTQSLSDIAPEIKGVVVEARLLEQRTLSFTNASSSEPVEVSEWNSVERPFREYWLYEPLTGHSCEGLIGKQVPVTLLDPRRCGTGERTDECIFDRVAVPVVGGDFERFASGSVRNVTPFTGTKRGENTPNEFEPPDTIVLCNGVWTSRECHAGANHTLANTGVSRTRPGSDSVG